MKDGYWTMISSRCIISAGRDMQGSSALLAGRTANSHPSSDGGWCHVQRKTEVCILYGRFSTGWLELTDEKDYVISCSHRNMIACNKIII
ncbi:hypothetical protein HNY73_019930 [Argiope bruennichi]|uniref:Uncharacterized protein n=1 Tax=Argiope bruennichi TaxID=94029 RepID=A0A8T0E8X9_ARGBR|nr:hypothetical protein HNY73_019930 [Argiope bruennichi]